MKGIRKQLKILSAAGAVLAASVLLTALAFEAAASKNLAVNISKRAAAEAGALVSRVFLNSSNANRFSFGPKGAGVFPPRKRAGEYLKVDPAITEVRWNDYEISGCAKTFDYEDLSDPRLKLLRDRYHLTGVVSPAKNEYEKIVLLRRWVKGAIPRGKPSNVDYNFNALNILERAKKGETFFCSEYSTVFIQCALSLGLQARYVGLFKGHAVAEVWSDDYAKWIVMDVDKDLHYERDGLPLNALELHDIWEERAYDGVRVHGGDSEPVDERRSPEYLLSFYHEFYVRMRNDWFSNKYPHWHHKGNSIMNGIEWRDRYTKNSILVSRETAAVGDIYFPINIVSLKMTDYDKISHNIGLVLHTFTPGFLFFYMSLDNDPPHVLKDDSYNWALHKGLNKLRVRAVNAMGVTGPESSIELTLN